MTAASDLASRVLSRAHVVADHLCWWWTGAVDSHGYGAVKVGGQARGAHRVVYELMVGPVPQGHVLDHLCRVRRCVNPAHVEPVTARENTLRGTGPTARWAARTHCPEGHAFTAENTGTRPDGQGRLCLTCHPKGT